ncbi:hypothetical protein [Enterovirga sp. CN4-39]
MFGMFKLAGLSAVLAAALVIATGAPSVHVQPEIRPTLVVAFE